MSDTLTLYFDPTTPPPGSPPGAAPAKPAATSTSSQEDGYGDLRQAWPRAMCST
ncbi:MAG: hypothetical protein WDN45_06690 [Caulobacteraceae bacterium]